jgi:tetratricopeptide (TPR) repeat protein
MTTAPSSSAGGKTIGLIIFAVIATAVAAGGCALLLPIYSRACSAVLLKEGAQASANGNDDRAYGILTQAIALAPRSSAAYEVRTDVDVAKGNYVQAVADYKKAIEIDPKNALMINNLAWVLATCPDASVRDGKQAIEYANLACKLTNFQNGGDVDTLAAAYAETGDFDSAIKWETKYLNSLSLSPSDAADGQARLALYQAHKPYHEDK